MPAPGLIMVDPSFMLSAEGLDWLESDVVARGATVVPRIVADAIAGDPRIDLTALVADADREQLESRRNRASALITDVRTFSHEDVVLSRRSHEAVRIALLFEDDRVGEVHADEWVFLQTNSVLLSKVRRPLDAFRDAGAVIVELGRKAGLKVIEKVIPEDHIPPSITKKIIATAAAKWIVLGGANVAGGTLGGVAGTAIGGPFGGVLGGAAGKYAFGSASEAALLAIDP